MITEKLGTAGDHPRLDGFDAYYEQQIAPSLAKFEKARQEAWSKAPWSILPFAIGLLGLALQNDVMAIAGGVVGALVLVFVWTGVSQAKGDHTKFVAGKVCDFFGLSYSRSPTTDVIPWFQNLNLLPHYDRKSVEDHITGDLDGTDVLLMEVELEEEHEREDSEGRTETYYETVFEGLLVIATFPKKFESRTVITEDSGLFNFFKGMSHSGERAKLEDPRFEDHFEVFTTDQVECRYLLTPTFMERLVDVSARFGHGVQAAFDEDKFLLTIESGRSWFEAEGQSSDLTDPTATVDMIDDVVVLFDIVDQLSLNAKTKV